MLKVLILRFKVTSGPTNALRFGIRTEVSNSDPEGASRCFLLSHAEVKKN